MKFIKSLVLDQTDSNIRPTHSLETRCDAEEQRVGAAAFAGVRQLVEREAGIAEIHLVIEFENRLA